MINIDKEKLISVDDFCNEMSRLIYYFDQTINTIRSNSKALVVFLTLIKKIISNADAANKLIFEGHIKEAKIILRSAVESVILITYLSQFPEKIEDYLDEAQILKIKNNFIIYKNMRDGEPIDVNETTITKEELIVVSEAKYQGKDIENIKKGKLVGVNNNQILMAAGNAIERAHKNIHEIANLMLMETHFPYILFLEGSNFLTENVTIKRPDGTSYTIIYNDGTLNRLDRLTSANYGMPINTNLCENKFVSHGELNIMLQAASIYTKGDGRHWGESEMIEIMLDVAKTSLKMLGKDLFKQLTHN